MTPCKGDARSDSAPWRVDFRPLLPLESDLDVDVVPS